MRDLENNKYFLKTRPNERMKRLLSDPVPGRVLLRFRQLTVFAKGPCWVQILTSNPSLLLPPAGRKNKASAAGLGDLSVLMVYFKHFPSSLPTTDRLKVG